MWPSLFCFWSQRRSFQPITVKHDVSCRLFIYGLYYVGTAFFHSYFVECFHHDFQHRVSSESGQIKANTKNEAFQGSSLTDQIITILFYPTQWLQGDLVFMATVVARLFKNPVESRRGIWEQAKLKHPKFSVLNKSHLFFFNKHSLDCCKPLIPRVLKKLTLQFLPMVSIDFMEELNF